MPSKTLRQHNLMAMVANNPKAAKRLGIPQSVGEEYIKADKGRKFGSGSKSRPTLQKINRPKTAQGQDKLYKDGGSVMKKLFKGKESYSEELKEAKAIKSGKITPQQYARGEKMEDEMKKPKRMKDGGKADEDRITPEAEADMRRIVEEARKQRMLEEAYRRSMRNTPMAPAPAPMRPRVQPEAPVREMPVRKMAKGGMVKCRGDGIAQRGKTKGRFVK